MMIKYFNLLIIVLIFYNISYGQVVIEHPYNKQEIILHDNGTWEYAKKHSVVAYYDSITGLLHDNRDGQNYKTIAIGNQVWMAENLNYPSDKSWCYNNKPGHCNEYGRLYTYVDANKVCPPGWHLPSKEEWEKFISEFGGEEIAGKFIKSEKGYLSFRGKDGNGTNKSGFNALPTGMRGDHDQAFNYLSKRSYFWSSIPMDMGRAWGYAFFNSDDKVHLNYFSKNYGFSVRCVKD
jgi:uncharacterized protein (TIGR02145 family)